MNITFYNDWKRHPTNLIILAFSVDVEESICLHFWLFGFCIEVDL